MLFESLVANRSHHRCDGNVQAFPSLPWFPKGKRLGNDTTPAAIETCSVIDPLLPIKKSKREVLFAGSFVLRSGTNVYARPRIICIANSAISKTELHAAKGLAMQMPPAQKVSAYLHNAGPKSKPCLDGHLIYPSASLCPPVPSRLRRIGHLHPPQRPCPPPQTQPRRQPQN